MNIGGAVAAAEGGGGGEQQLLLDEAGLGVVLGQTGQTLLQGGPQEVQALGGAAQTALGLGGAHTNYIHSQCE